MEIYCFIFAFFMPCLSEWVQLPSIFPKKNDVNDQICLDMHNLTVMTYGSTDRKTVNSGNDWGISLDDVTELIKQNQQLPKSTKEKADFVKKLEENLMSEAEKRLRSVFSSSRESRTIHIHSPSMESALMTISMLLFGVFLSKLILKLLLSHYNRYNGGVMTMMSGIRRPVTIAHGRRGRSLETQLQKIQLMHLIDKYNSRFN